MNCNLARAILAGCAMCLLTADAFAQGPTNFAILANDGAWTWYNDSRALFHNGKLYVGYVRALDDKTTLSVFDLATGQAADIWVAGFTQQDDHNNPGLLAKQDGRMLAVYSRHIADQYFSYRTSNSTNPITAAGWNAEQSIPNSGAGMTYANPFQLSAENGKIFNFCRNQNFNPTVYTSTNGGSNWSAPQLFIQAGSGGTVRPYVKYSSDSTQRIDFLYTDGHPRDVTNSLYHLYYQTNVFHKTDGTFVKSYGTLPILHDSGERGSVIYQYSTAAQADPNQWIPTGRAWNWEIASQTNGDPVCVFTVQRDNVTGGVNGTDDRIYYYYARWTGANWQKRFIAHAGRPIYPAEDDYAGGICLDPQDVNTIYISSNANDPFNLTDTTNVTLRANQRYELWRGVTSDGGLTFTWTQITTNSSVDNFRPYIPRRNGGEPCVLWFRGTYNSYTSYSCSIVGLFTTQVPTNGVPPTNNVPGQITYVDATSGVGGNTTLANGSIFTPPTNGTTGADNNWEQRTPLGSGGNIYEAGGEAAENAPELRTRISGLVAGASYSIYIHFWDPTSTTEDWNVRAGFSSNPGSNTLFSAADAAGQLSSTTAVLASDLTYLSAPTIFSESGRALLAGLVGTTTANGSGVIDVFIDDRPSGIGANNRTWYDGIGYGELPPQVPTNLTATPGDAQVTLSWDVANGATGYKLKRSLTGGGSYTPIASNLTSLVFTNTGLTNGTTYYYVVSATNAGGESTNSTEASATPLSAFQTWQLRYFDCTNCPAADPDADPLGKGISNTNQFLLGLNPTNGASLFRILSAVLQGSNVNITWQTAGVRTNALQATGGDTSGIYSNNFADIPGSMTVISGSGDAVTNYTDVDAATNSPTWFYRVRLVP